MPRVIQVIRWLAALLIVCSAVPASIGAASLRLEGRVENEQGLGAGDVVVETVYRGHRYFARTAPDGGFVLKIDSDQFDYGTIRALTDDGAAQAFHRLDEAQAKGGTVGGLKLVLKPAREFAVSVKDEGGRPVEGAWVVASAHYTPVGETTTGAAGMATLRIPVDATPQHVLAVKGRAGLDYVLFWRKDQAKTDPYRLDANHAGPLSFVLNGTKQIAVRAVDEQQRPLSGVEVYPWYYEKPRKGDDVNLSGLPSFKATTDASGMAHFHVPVDNTGPVTFWPRLDGHTAPARPVWDPKSGSAEVKAVLARQVRVAGRVVDEDGRPAAGARVRVGGDGYQTDSFRGEARADDDGTFRIDVDPNQYYLFLADRGPLVSRAQMRIVRQAPPPVVELALAPAIRLRGVVTAGASRAPLAGASASLVTRDEEQSYLKLSKEEQFPGGVSGRRSILPSVVQHGRAGADGSFAFHAGPGLHQLNVYGKGAQKLTSLKLSDDQKQYTLYHFAPDLQRSEETRAVPETGIIQLDIHLDDVPGAAPSLLKGRVVERGRPEAGVAEATLSGCYIGHDDFFPGAKSDKQGHFAFPRGKSDLYLSAVTADGKWRGIVIVKAGDNEPVGVPLGPMASAAGTLIDHEGKPLVGRSVRYGVRIAKPGGSFSTNFGGDVETDAEGRFVIDRGLVPGFDYELSVVIGFGDEGRPNSWRTVGKARADGLERVAMGSITLPAPYQPKTWKDYLADAFGQKRPLAERLEDAARTARLSYQHVLVVLGAPNRPACEQLYELWHHPNRRDVWTALVDYVPVVINVDAANADARSWAARMKLKWPERDMTLAVLDLEARLVAQASGAALGPHGNLERDRLVEFARRHAPTKPDARQLLNEALAQARREGKHVLLDESAAYCPPCVTLSKYLEANQALLAKDFVVVTLDRRFAYGEQVMKSLRPQDVSTPWTAVLTADGKPVITSDGPGGNIGYPTDGASRAQWEKMLRSAAWRLTEPEIGELMRNLSGR